MRRILIIDDARNASRDPQQAGPNDLLFDKDDYVIICRDFHSGLECLQALPTFDLLFLDRDLGTFSADGREWTGEDILKELQQMPVKIPQEVRIITGNIAARPRMEVAAHQLQALRKP